MKYIAALYSNGRVVTGNHHGEAFEKLTSQEQNSEICSGFLDPESGKFHTDCGDFFTKDFILVRHGQTHGELDSPLCDIGKSQVIKVANHLLTQELEGFEGFVSPYQRCLETADIISEITGIKFSINLDIREKVVQQERISSHSDKFPDFYWPKNDDWHFFPEEIPQFIQRIDMVASKLPKKSLLVSHCDFILNFLQEAVDQDIIECVDKMPFASLSAVSDRNVLCVGKQFP